jgi:dephospho-CoA kinase
MLKIGVTGGIGSGKTTVCKVFETLGIPVFYADTSAKEIMVRDLNLAKGIKATFGEESYTADGILNNKYLANLVFNNPKELEKLNALVHPAVFRGFDLWLSKVPVHVPYILKEAALLFESGSYKACDYSLLVVAPLQNKLKRVMKRDGIAEEQVKARMDKQLSDEEKIKMADFFIRNEETESLILQVYDLHHQFLKKA